MKTSPVGSTPSFYCFNMNYRGNVRKNKTILFCANCCFSKFTRNRLRNFFLNCCAFPFSGAKRYGLKKNGVTGLIFLFISDISKKSDLENPFGMLPW